LIALIQATETVKIITGIGEPLYGRLIQYDALRMEFNEFRLKKDPKCPVCGEQPSVTELIDYQGFCGMTEAGGAEIAELSAAAVQSMQARGDDFLLLDVRESDEFMRARIEGSILIPLGELEDRLAEIRDWKQRPVVVHCHHGGRSAKACKLLGDAGFSRVTNLTGGIEAWSLTVDADISRY
jgi:adenylyltransferase/sulfurtransferase